MAGFGDIPIRKNGLMHLISAEWFNTIRTKLIAAFGSGGYIAEQAEQVVTNGGTITIPSAEVFKPMIPIKSDTGTAVLADAPFGTSHGFNGGKEIVLMGTDDALPVEILNKDVAGGFISSRGKLVISKFKITTLVYSATLDRFLEME